MCGLQQAEYFPWKLTKCQDIFSFLTMSSWGLPVDLQFGKFMGKVFRWTNDGHKRRQPHISA